MVISEPPTGCPALLLLPHIFILYCRHRTNIQTHTTPHTCRIKSHDQQSNNEEITKNDEQKDQLRWLLANRKRNRLSTKLINDIVGLRDHLCRSVWPSVSMYGQKQDFLMSCGSMQLNLEDRKLERTEDVLQGCVSTAKLRVK